MKSVGFDPKLIAVQLDGRVLAALETAKSESFERVVELSGAELSAVVATMHRLALRVPGVNWPGGDILS